MTDILNPIEELEEGTVIILSESFKPKALLGDEKVIFEYEAGSCARVFCAHFGGTTIKDILIGNGSLQTPFITANPNNSELAKIAAQSRAEAINKSTYAISQVNNDPKELCVYKVEVGKELS